MPAGQQPGIAEAQGSVSLARKRLHASFNLGPGWSSGMLWARCAALVCGLIALCGTAAAAPLGLEPVQNAICRTIEASAHDAQLPIGFLTRIIWRESSFRAGVVSPAGAQGIA